MQSNQNQEVDVAEEGKGHAEAKQLESNLILLAIVGISDPLRAEVVTAVQQCNRAGITVRMLTGMLCPWPCHRLLHSAPFRTTPAPLPLPHRHLLLPA